MAFFAAVSFQDGRGVDGSSASTGTTKPIQNRTAKNHRTPKVLMNDPLRGAAEWRSAFSACEPGVSVTGSLPSSRRCRSRLATASNYCLLAASSALDHLLNLLQVEGTRRLARRIFLHGQEELPCQLLE